jgi:hypothetical protein
VAITDHPFLDNNGPTYMFGVCGHSVCGRRERHACPRRLCGKAAHEHETMIRADRVGGRHRIEATP